MSEYRAYDEDSAELDPSSPFFLDHVSRYWWAAEQLAGLDVLDCACGKGYGTFILSSRARTACGADLNQRSLEIARRTFARSNLEYVSRDILDLASLGRTFDAVVAFEVIEHIPPAETDRFLAGIRKVLRPGGTLLLSTPNHDVVTKSGSAVPEFHINNFKPADLRASLKRHFNEVRMLGQYRRRQGLSGIVFDLDFLNLRHSLGRRLVRSSGGVASLAEAPPRKVADPRAVFERPYPGVDQYRFSPRHWRQAGLTVATCR